MLVEEKYGSVVKEKKLLEEKERILLNTLDSLKEFSALKMKDLDAQHVVEDSNDRVQSQNTQSAIIDITGEENIGSSSLVHSCEDCDYKASVESSLRHHIQSKHIEFDIACEDCDFIGNADNYLDHMRKKHGALDAEKGSLGKGKKAPVSNRKPDSVVIPCDVCRYVSNSTSEYLKHIEKHRAKEVPQRVLRCDLCDFIARNVKDLKDHLDSTHIENHKTEENPEVVLPCDLCDFVANNVKNFKDHLESSHGFNVKSNSSVRKKSGYCIFWNRGHCKYGDEKCFYEHKSIPDCRFQERCRKDDCKYFHHEGLNKFPFLVKRPNLRPKVQSGRMVSGRQTFQSHPQTVELGRQQRFPRSCQSKSKNTKHDVQ